MRDYGTSELKVWEDYLGRQWRVVQSARRLKFKNPSHAALRAHVFHRDGYKCRRCDAQAVNVPDNYSGRYTLQTDTSLFDGSNDILVVDHVLTLRAGGVNAVENFQTLCETCNKTKQREDREAFNNMRPA